MLLTPHPARNRLTSSNKRPQHTNPLLDIWETRGYSIMILQSFLTHQRDQSIRATVPIQHIRKLLDHFHIDTDT